MFIFINVYVYVCTYMHVHVCAYAYKHLCTNVMSRSLMRPNAMHVLCLWRLAFLGLRWEGCVYTELSSNLRELKVNFWERMGIILPRKVKGYLLCY